MPRKRKKTPEAPRRSALSAVLTTLRLLRGWTQTEVAQAAGVRRGTIAACEADGVEPPPEAAGRIAAALGVSPRIVAALATLFAALGALLSRLGNSRGDGAAEEIVAGALRCAVLLVRAVDRIFPPLPAEEAPAEDFLSAAGLWQRLEPLELPVAQAVVHEEPEFHSAALVKLLCEKSECTAADDADRAVELAALALFTAARLPGTPALRNNAQAHASGHLGNARRVQGKLPAAGEAFSQAAVFSQAGVGDDSGLFDEVCLLDLEASFRRAQRELPAALDLLDRALAADPAGPRAGRILVKRAKTLEEMGDYEEAIATLRRALPLVDGERDPRLLWGLYFNLAENLFQVGRFAEAEPLLPGVYELAERLGNDLDRVRYAWLEARRALALGRPEEAAAGFETVRRAFLSRTIAFDAALVSLELAALYLQQGRTAEVQEIAAELLPVFAAQNVKREALATVQLFCDAAREERLTAEMTERCLKDLRRGAHG
jgi:tetratricopeptide (TPR) repeat protein